MGNIVFLLLYIASFPTVSLHHVNICSNFCLKKILHLGTHEVLNCIMLRLLCRAVIINRKIFSSIRNPVSICVLTAETAYVPAE